MINFEFHFSLVEQLLMGNDFSVIILKYNLETCNVCVRACARARARVSVRLRVPYRNRGSKSRIGSQKIKIVSGSDPCKIAVSLQH